MRGWITIMMLVAGLLATRVEAQFTLDFPVDEIQPYQLDSRVLSNSAALAATVFEHTVQIDGAAWVRLYFGEVELDAGSLIRVTSLLDGQVQELDAAALAKWTRSTAYFNGDGVRIELIAGPQTQRNRLVVSEVAVQTGVVIPTGSCGICGPDDRVPSNDNAACRLLPAGCSATVFSQESCVVSAGHCIGGSMVLQFNVPESNPDCSLNHPPVADQFPVIQVEFENSGAGNDWAVLQAGSNGTGQAPYDRYGLLRPLAQSPTIVGQPLTIWGYGIDDECVRSQSQQTSDGTVQASGPLFLRHDVDATYGNSGSSVVRAGEVVGIATHCPCPNYATTINHPAFFDAIVEMCPPVEQLTIALPLIDAFLDTTIDEVQWLTSDGTINDVGINELTPPYSLNLDGSISGGDQLRSAFMDLSGLSGVKVKYAYQMKGSGNIPENGEDLVVEYRSSAGQWVELIRHPGGSAEIPTQFDTVAVDLPPDAYHQEFRIRVRALSFNPGSDDWFIDNICVGTAAQCDCQAAGDCDDGVPCTVDDCAETFCLNMPEDGACDDGIPCTADVCSGAEGCQSTPDDVLCDDGVDCTQDSCDALLGCFFVPHDFNCSDGNPCTADVCDAVEGCQFIPIGDCSGVQGVVVTDATDPGAAAQGLSVCNVYVEFGAPDDRLLNIGFSDISTTDPAGFYQHEFGGDRAPQQLLVDMFPELAYDSFVDIGLQVVPVGQTDTTGLDGDWDSSLFNNGGSTAGGWFNSNPANEQGLPDENGQVFVAQFTVQQGHGVSGTMSAFFNDGLVQVPVSFECAFADCPADLNGDGEVDPADLAQLLGGWGACPGCPADLDGDGVVNASDLAILLGSWGPCSSR